MDPIIGGALIGVGGSLIGGLMGQEGAREQAEVAERNNARNIEMQKEFAKNGLTWKIEDAKKHGISPLAAIGSQSANSFQPTSTTAINTKEHMGSAIANSGQDLGKAFVQSQHRQDLLNQQQGTELDLKIKEAQYGLILAQTQALGPRTPTNPAINPNLDKYATKSPEATITWYPQPNGRIMALPSKEATEALENDVPASMSFQSQRALGAFNPNVAGSGAELPKGFDYWERDGLFMWKPAKFNIPDSERLKIKLDEAVNTSIKKHGVKPGPYYDNKWLPTGKIKTTPGLWRQKSHEYDFREVPRY